MVFVCSGLWLLQKRTIYNIYLVENTKILQHQKNYSYRFDAKLIIQSLSFRSESTQGRVHDYNQTDEMSNSERKQKFIVLASAAVAAISASFFIEELTTDERHEKKRKRNLAPYKRNQSDQLGTPTTELQAVPCLHRLLADDNRAYVKHTTHLHTWQFLALAEKLKPLVERPRLRSDGTRAPNMNPQKPCKFDYKHRLFFCLKWLNDGNVFRTREAEIGWSKSAIQEDLMHVLMAVIEGLDNQLKWPNAIERRRIIESSRDEVIFRGCIGIGDVKEIPILRPKDPWREHKTFSGKHKMHSQKLLSVIDRTGRIIFFRICLGNNDRECLTQSPLYLQQGLYFADDEWIASDGGFEGDGPFRCSYKNTRGNIDKQLYNVTFKEVRTGVENKYNRVGQWFPLLGNNKKRLNYSEITITLAVHAAARLHNWIMNIEGLNYDARVSPETLFNHYY